MFLLGPSERAALAPEPADDLSVARVPGISVATTAVVPQPATAPPQDATPEQPAPQAAPPGPSLSELPIQEVDPRSVHAVPEAAPAPVPHVTIQDRQGRPVGRLSSAAPPPPSYVPSVGPGSHNEASSAPSSRPSAGPAPDYIAPTPPPATYRPSVGPALPDVASSRPPTTQQPSTPGAGAAGPPVEHTASVPSASSQFSGPAHATGTVSLAVDGHSVRLYGVLPPASTDRCTLGTGAPQTCAEVTQVMLAAKLARTTSVTCQLPAGASPADPARICRDAAGVDLAGFLVSEGLAVADEHTKAGYAGAESTARSSGKGLWRFR